MPFREQIDGVRRYLGTLRADSNRAGRDSGIDLRQRRVCPTLDSLKWMRLQAARELQEVGEKALRDLKHAQVLHYAEFFPGDLVEVAALQSARPLRWFLIVDADESARTKSIRYDVWQLTRTGRLFERGGQSMLCPSKYVTIRPLTISLAEDALNAANYFRTRARDMIERCRDRGDLAPVLKEVRKRRNHRMCPVSSSNTTA